MDEVNIDKTAEMYELLAIDLDQAADSLREASEDVFQGKERLKVLNSKKILEKTIIELEIHLIKSQNKKTLTASL